MEQIFFFVTDSGTFLKFSFFFLYCVLVTQYCFLLLLFFLIVSTLVVSCVLNHSFGPKKHRVVVMGRYGQRKTTPAQLWENSMVLSNKDKGAGHRVVKL